MKDYNIHTTFNGEARLFQCPPSEFLERVKKVYNINDISDVDIYVIEKDVRRQILPCEIRDLMKLEFVLKTAEKNGQRSLRSSFGGESSKNQTMVEQITEKLRNGTTLNGAQRKYLLEMLDRDAVRNPIAEKRKHEEDSSYPKPATSSKKVQVRVPLQDLSTQTESDVQNGVEDSVGSQQSSQGENPVVEADILTLKKLACVPKTKEIKREIKQLMTSTYDARRKFIVMENPLVAAVKEKYPALFSVEEVKNELERIFWPGKCEEFLSNIDKYARVILDYCDPLNEVCKRTLRSIEKAHSKQQKKYAEAVGSILIIPTLLKEELGFLNVEDNVCTSEVFPYISAAIYALKDLFFDNILFSIITEQRELCQASNFKEAILCLMASFFIFDISYPESCEQTLILFEKLYLCGNDTPDTLVVGTTEQLIKLFKLQANA